MIDDDEVGLKEKPEDTRYMYIKWSHKNKTQRLGCGQTKDWIPNFMPLLGTADSWAGSSHPEGSWEEMKSKPRGGKLSW